jgi:hypothetical protein
VRIYGEECTEDGRLKVRRLQPRGCEPRKRNAAAGYIQTESLPTCAAAHHTAAASPASATTALMTARSA